MMQILHGFADTGVESYILQEYGEVTRLGIDPKPGLRNIDNFEGAKEIIRANGLKMPFKDNQFDLGFIHPPCTPYSKWVSLNEAQIDGYSRPKCIISPAREEIKRVAKHYVIENVTRAPIRQDVVLKGPMFDINFRKARAFEASFNIDTPPSMPDNYRYTSESKTSKYVVMRKKGYPDLWPGKEAMNASIPAPYIRHIMDSFLSNR